MQKHHVFYHLPSLGPCQLELKEKRKKKEASRGGSLHVKTSILFCSNVRGKKKKKKHWKRPSKSMKPGRTMILFSHFYASVISSET